MKFKNRRFITKGIAENIPLCLQLFMWMCIDTLPCEKDYLQVFKFTEKGVTHIQEEPEYKREYLFKDAPQTTDFDFVSGLRPLAVKQEVIFRKFFRKSYVFVALTLGKPRGYAKLLIKWLHCWE